MNRSKNPAANPPAYLLALRKLIYGVLRGLDALTPGAKNSLVVLNYHGIGDNDYRFDVTEKSFGEQVDYLLAHGYTFISVATLEEWLTHGRIPHGLYALLTFDDGNRSVLRVREFLKSRGIRPAIFIVTDIAHTDRSVLSPEFEPMTPADLRDVQREGWEIGGHSATHQYLPRVLDEAARTRELDDSKQTLEAIVGAPTPYFAYPHGGYDAKTIDAVRGAGYTLAFSTDEAILTPHTNKYTIPRVGVNKSHSLAEFKAVITPLSLRLKPLIKRFYE